MMQKLRRVDHDLASKEKGDVAYASLLNNWIRNPKPILSGL
jgi:hypothetical protein